MLYYYLCNYSREVQYCSTVGDISIISYYYIFICIIITSSSLFSGWWWDMIRALIGRNLMHCIANKQYNTICQVRPTLLLQ